jgi:hypothetical protein
MWLISSMARLSAKESSMVASKASRTPLVYPCGEPPVPGMAKENVAGVLWLRMPLPLSLSHINLWAVRDIQSWAIFDTGMYTHATVQAGFPVFVGIDLLIDERTGLVACFTDVRQGFARPGPAGVLFVLLAPPIAIEKADRHAVLAH